MGELWFWFAALLVVGWAVLDGFDFGVGVLHRVVARTDAERRQVLASIGPVWDGNEVWLLAAGGTLFLAFPRVVAAGFSGLYLPIVFALWGLMGRAVAIELRSHLPSTLWRAFFDTVFTVSSVLVPVLFGAALGNVIRGVPLTAEGVFELPLFGDFAVDGAPGALDWYTLTIAVFVLVTLVAHGANWLVWKTDGAVQARAKGVKWLWGVVLLFWGLASGATWRVAPELFAAFSSRPLAWVGLGLTVGAMGLVAWSLRGGHELRAFLGSGAFIAGLLITTVACAYPVLLRSRADPAFSLTVDNARTLGDGPASAVGWWLPALGLAIGYFVWVMRNFRGKVRQST